MQTGCNTKDWPENQRAMKTPEKLEITQDLHSSCLVHVCTSCRQPGTAREPKANRSGFILYEQLCKAFANSGLRGQVEVRAAQCLSICPRPCGIAVSMPGKWTYLFGDQQKDKAMSDVVECVSAYLNAPDGFMSRESRPHSLRKAILGRVPPRQEIQECI